MKKATVVLLIIPMLILSACAGQPPAPQAAAPTQVSAADTQAPGATAAAVNTPPVTTATVSLDTPTSPNPPTPAAPDESPTPTGGVSSTGTITAVYAQDGGSETSDSQTYTAVETNQSAIYVNNSGKLTLANAAITSSGSTSSQDNSSLNGLNAAVLAAGGSRINLSDSSIATSGSGANGAFATDARSAVTLSNVTIQTSADGGHGVMATNGGSMILTNVDITTAGSNSGAVASGRGGGTINITGGKVITSGQNSPDLYSTGAISVTGGAMSATASEAAVIEGGSSITLTKTSLFSNMKNWGVLIYQSTAGDAQGTGGKGAFSMTSGSLSYAATGSPLFYVTNSTALITLKELIISSASKILVQAAAGDWGSSGANGGNVIFTADRQDLNGDLVADKISTITLNLKKDATLTGTINADHTAKSILLTMDATTSWDVTGDSYLTCLTDPGEIFDTVVGNITGNGYTVYYEASACPKLRGRTYTLNDGGYLKPAN